MNEQKIYLSVIIPAYNEGERIIKTINIISKYLQKQSYIYEIIVVSDGSKDNTADIVNKLTLSTPNLQLIDRKINRGKGHTVKEGMLRAQGEIRLFTDADNSTDISHFDLMKPLFDEGYDIVICSRDEKDAKGAHQDIPQKWYKRMLGNMGNLFIQIVAVRGIWDTQCGFKAFRARSAEKIFSQTKIDRWGFDIEVLALARHLKYKLGIVPANWINDPDSRVSATAYFQVLWETVKIRWNFIAGKYDL